MPLSMRAIRLYLGTMAICVATGVVTWKAIAWWESPVTAMALELLSVLWLVFIVSYVQKRGDRYHELAPPEFTGDLARRMVVTCAVRGLAQFYLGAPRPDAVFASVPLTLALYPLKSFLFEVCFDFMFYWAHRLMHSDRRVYGFVHKLHHSYIGLSAVVLTYMSVPDVVLTYALPLAVCTRLVPFGPLEYHVQVAQLLLQELQGHTGEVSFPVSGFPPFPWLPRRLRCELYSEDHAAHHLYPRHNFGKRFALWDKVFGTYRHPVVSATVMPSSVSSAPAVGMLLRSGREKPQAPVSPHRRARVATRYPQ